MKQGRPYRVVIRASSLKDVPGDIDAGLQASIHEIAGTVGNIPAHHTAFWDSLALGPFGSI